MEKTPKIKQEKMWDPSLDAVIAAPDSHTIKLENEKVRILEVIIPPGVKEPMHTHNRSSIMIVQSSAKIRYYDENGNFNDYQKREIDSNNPHIEWMGPEGLHAVENIDTVQYRAIRLEFKK